MTRFLLIERRKASRPVLLALLALLTLTGCEPQQPQALPDQMIGEWRTGEPRFQGRFMKLETGQITFGLGGIAPDRVEHIEKVSAASNKNPFEYTIRLKTVDGATDSIVLQFSPQNGGELRLKSQPKIVWSLKSQPARTLPKVVPGESSQHAVQPPTIVLGEHRTIYKIDCTRPHVCRSY